MVSQDDFVMISSLLQARIVSAQNNPDFLQFYNRNGFRFLQTISPVEPFIRCTLQFLIQFNMIVSIALAYYGWLPLQ